MASKSSCDWRTGRSYTEVRALPICARTHGNNTPPAASATFLLYDLLTTLDEEVSDSASWLRMHSVTLLLPSSPCAHPFAVKVEYVWRCASPIRIPGATQVLTIRKLCQCPAKVSVLRLEVHRAHRPAVSARALIALFHICFLPKVPLFPRSPSRPSFYQARPCVRTRADLARARSDVRTRSEFQYEIDARRVIIDAFIRIWRSLLVPVDSSVPSSTERRHRPRTDAHLAACSHLTLSRCCK